MFDQNGQMPPQPPTGAPTDTVGPKLGTPQPKRGFGGMIERILAARAMKGQKPQGAGGFGMPMPRINTAEDQAAKQSVFGQMMGRLGPVAGNHFGRPGPSGAPRMPQTTAGMPWGGMAPKTAAPMAPPAPPQPGAPAPPPPAPPQNRGF